ncbi:hypothetical protein [Sulfurimonas diazotrophicus]|uniref:DUF4139 domain-containing protein n=1 Tax=Sulfurimonas diazotrophicus TaxID=3131939 RepID=A0ABZ3H8P0_9BACT
MHPTRPLFLTLLASPLLFAATLSPASTETALVIYNAGIGLVHEKRQLTVEKGKQSIVYPGVATTVQTDAVSVKLPSGVTLYSQQYRFDKITLSKIIEANIGKRVRFKTGDAEHPGIGGGTLLAASPAVVRTDRGIESGINNEDFIFDAIPDTLIMKPSLVWNVEASKRIRGEMALDYLIGSIQWKSDYTLTMDGDKGDLTGWITVDNRSGKRFEDTKLHLLAGEINRAAQPRLYVGKVMMEAAAAPVAEQAVEGYHLYSVPFEVTLADNEKTQIRFIDRPSHALKRRYEVTMPAPLQSGAELKRPVSQFVDLEGFDIPLPAGTVRTYAETDGTTILLGESALDNTPKDETVTLRLGTNFDLVAKSTLETRKDEGSYWNVKVAYRLSNRSDSAKDVDVLVPGVSSDGKATIKSTLSYERRDGYTIRFSPTLKAGETKTWQVTYRSPKP